MNKELGYKTKKLIFFKQLEDEMLLLSIQHGKDFVNPIRVEKNITFEVFIHKVDSDMFMQDE